MMIKRLFDIGTILIFSPIFIPLTLIITLVLFLKQGIPVLFIQNRVGKNNKMTFCQWSFKDPLSINTYGIPEPISKKKINPEILLIPLVAFDSGLNRLGYGGGFYDRYISSLQKDKRIIKIGLGFSFQQINKIPINQFDKKLDYIITDKNILG